MLNKMDDVTNYMTLIDKVNNDRLAMKEVISKVVDKIIMNSITPLKNNQISNQFIISFFLYGKGHPISVLFDRKENTKSYNKTLDKVIYYKDNLLQDDLDKLLEIFNKIKFPRVGLVPVMW